MKNAIFWNVARVDLVRTDLDPSSGQKKYSSEESVKTLANRRWFLQYPHGATSQKTAFFIS
jgi:hypothetical protein